MSTIGYRFMSLMLNDNKEIILSSPSYYQGEWNGNPLQLKAECFATDNEGKRHSAHSKEVPAESCTCGIYSLGSVYDLYKQASYMNGFVAIVVLWGKIFHGERGYRSQFARIDSVLPPLCNVADCYASADRFMSVAQNRIQFLCDEHIQDVQIIHQFGFTQTLPSFRSVMAEYGVEVREDLLEQVVKDSRKARQDFKAEVVDRGTVHSASLLIKQRWLTDANRIFCKKMRKVLEDQTGMNRREARRATMYMFQRFRMTWGEKYNIVSARDSVDSELFGKYLKNRVKELSHSPWEKQDIYNGIYERLVLRR